MKSMARSTVPIKNVPIRKVSIKNDRDPARPHQPGSRRIGIIAATAPVVAAAALLFVSPSPEFIERYYSNGFYPVVQSVLTSVSNTVGFAISDFLLVFALTALLCWWTISLIRAPRGRRLRRLTGLALRSIVAASVVYLVFLLLWGFNYSRLPLSNKLDYDRARVTSDSVRNVKRVAAERLNSDYLPASSDEWPADAVWRRELGGSFGQVVSELGGSNRFRPGVPKRTMLNS